MANRKHPLRNMLGAYGPARCWVLTPEGVAAVSSADSIAEDSGESQHLVLRAAAAPSGHTSCPSGIRRLCEGRLPEGWVITRDGKGRSEAAG
jgi:hypothetical protein